MVGIVASRTAAQAEKLNKTLKNIEKFRFLRQPVDGLNLIWNADLVVGGGGTMNREAAMLEVPVYSVFMGQLGAIDRALAERGKLVLLRSPEEVKEIDFHKRPRPDSGPQQAIWQARSAELVEFVVEQIIDTATQGKAH